MTQGSSIEDVTVYAGKDAAVGISGAAGGGGAHVNVKVVGGRFGLDFRTSQPAPTATGVTLINQSCLPMIFNGRGPLSLIGAQVNTAHERVRRRCAWYHDGFRCARKDTVFYRKLCATHSSTPCVG